MEPFKLHKTPKGLEVLFKLSKQNRHIFCMLKTLGSNSVSLQFYPEIASLMSLELPVFYNGVMPKKIQAMCLQGKELAKEKRQQEKCV